MQVIEQYFNRIYLLNMEKDEERLNRMREVFNLLGMSNIKRWNAYTPETSDDMKGGHDLSPSYLACLKSHLTIIQNAYKKGYERILVIEDDVVPISDFHNVVFDYLGDVPEDWDLLYFSYIPLTEDRTTWSYIDFEIDFEKMTNSEEIVLVPEGLNKASEFWSLMSYGLSRRMMKVVLDFYNDNTLIELDRYFVDYVQKDERFKSYGWIPQPFAGIDNVSNNTNVEEKIFERSSHPNHRHKYLNI